jgi:signal transduction histidine kinase
MSPRRGNCSRPTEGHLGLTDLEPDRGKRVAVDLFFRSLADTHGPRAAAIILSGADADGAGIRRIKERGGLTIAQDPDEAEHRGMSQADKALAKGRASDERWHMRKDEPFMGQRSDDADARQARRGEAIGFVKIFRDRTAGLRAKEALENALKETERARADAEAANKAKDQFLGVLSHELRTPLTPVLMSAQTLSRRKDLPPVAIEALEMIGRNIEVQSRLIDDLLDLTRIGRGKMELAASRWFCMMPSGAPSRSASRISKRRNTASSGNLTPRSTRSGVISCDFSRCFGIC